MDDLTGLDFNAPKGSNPNHKGTPAQHIPPLIPTSSLISSGRSTPQPSTAQSGVTPTLRTRSAAKASNTDSFSGLVALNNAKKTNSLSLQERQKQLLEEKAQQQARQQAIFDGQFGHLEKINARGKNGSVEQQVTTDHTSVQSCDDESDILAAFNANAPVDHSSHLPPPTSKISHNLTSEADTDVSEDDPFGLRKLPNGNKGRATGAKNKAEEDGDILGALGRPVSEVKGLLTQKQDRQLNHEENCVSSMNENPQRKALSELMEMGFSITQATEALEQTDTGCNVESAVSYILTKAHCDSKRNVGTDKPEVPLNESQGQNRHHDAVLAADRDPIQYASQVRTNILKSANQLWKSGQKKVQKAVSELQQDIDPSQPKWMRQSTSVTRSETFRELEGGPEGTNKVAGPKNANQSKDNNITDEALMLEQRDSVKPIRPPTTENTFNRGGLAVGVLARSTIDDASKQLPRAQLHDPRVYAQRSAQSSMTLSRPNRDNVEQESANAYISPARRKGRNASISHSKLQELGQPDKNSLSLSDANYLSTKSDRKNDPKSQQTDTNLPQQTGISMGMSHMPVEPRVLPQISNAALESSASDRQKGSEGYKKGDYINADVHYTRAMASLPDNHPVLIIILCNRALTRIKIGDPKGAVNDADRALKIIGPGKGSGESIVLGQNDTSRDMKEFYGKILIRKAEALESMEKWSEAAKIWQEAIQVGAGGSISIQGRDRCEKAAAPATDSGASRRNVAQVRKVARPAPSATNDLTGKASAYDSKAVRTLRAANAAEKRNDDEKFVLADKVADRLTAWKGSKSDNLRALLGSLDKVLWEEAQWKPVGMSDLIMANKVKIIYMKAIAKVHPDKISPNASTEQRMISAAVFSTLNEAWDKFKLNNGL